VRLRGTKARFWMNQQTRYDLAIAKRDHGARIAAEGGLTVKKVPDTFC
jgi:plasmid maintenance system antidote protein VapI